MDQEIQQRANEYLALGAANMSEVKNTVLEMMPHFTERESVVQKQLAKSKGDGGAGRASEAKADDDDDEAPAPASFPVPTAAPPAKEPPVDLIGGLGDDAPPPPPEPDR